MEQESISIDSVSRIILLDGSRGSDAVLKYSTQDPSLESRDFGMTPFKTRARLTHYRSRGLLVMGYVSSSLVLVRIGSPRREQ